MPVTQGKCVVISVGIASYAAGIGQRLIKLTQILLALYQKQHGLQQELSAWVFTPLTRWFLQSCWYLLLSLSASIYGLITRFTKMHEVSSGNIISGWYTLRTFSLKKTFYPGILWTTLFGKHATNWSCTLPKCQCNPFPLPDLLLTFVDTPNTDRISPLCHFKYLWNMWAKMCYHSPGTITM